MFLVPTKLMPTALTRLFSLRTKVRMALELLHPPRPSDQDESVAALVERHFGQEAVDRLADPLLERNLRRRRRATQRANRAAAPCGDGTRSTARSLAACWPRIARCGREPRASSKDVKTAEPADLHRAARRHAATGRRARRKARPGQLVRTATPVSAIAKPAGGWSVEAARLARGLRRAHHGRARLGCAALCLRRSIPPSAPSSAAFPIHPRSPSISSTTNRRSANCPRASAFLFQQSKAAPCWPAPLSIASSLAARRRAKPCLPRLPRRHEVTKPLLGEPTTRLSPSSAAK